MKSSLIARISEAFSREGYTVIDCEGIRSSFDVLARDARHFYVVKVLGNIEGLTARTAGDLAHVAGVLHATPLVVGQMMKQSPLKDGVTYTRHGTLVVTPDTLSSILADEYTGTYAIRGNYCLPIDAAKLASLRRERGLNQQDLADRIGVSKQSIYRYESGGKAAVDVADRLEDFFGESLRGGHAFPGAFARDQLRDRQDQRKAEARMDTLTEQVRSAFAGLGMDASLTNAPFNVIALDASDRSAGRGLRGRKLREVLTVVSNDRGKLERRVEVVEEISDIVGGYSMAITERSICCDAAVISPGELSEISDAKTLLRLLRRRG